MLGGWRWTHPLHAVSNFIFLDNIDSTLSSIASTFNGVYAELSDMKEFWNTYLNVCWYVCVCRCEVRCLIETTNKGGTLPRSRAKVAGLDVQQSFCSWCSFQLLKSSLQMQSDMKLQCNNHQTQCHTLCSQRNGDIYSPELCAQSSPIPGQASSRPHLIL